MKIRNSCAVRGSGANCALHEWFSCRPFHEKCSGLLQNGQGLPNTVRVYIRNCSIADHDDTIVRLISSTGWIRKPGKIPRDKTRWNQWTENTTENPIRSLCFAPIMISVSALVASENWTSGRISRLRFNKLLPIIWPMYLVRIDVIRLQ